MTVSAIVPFHSHRFHLELCLNSLQKTREQLSEIILVTHKAGALRAAQRRHQVRGLHLERPLRYSIAANRAANEAKGDLLLFCDADTFFPDTAWISQHTLLHQNLPGVGATSSKLIDCRTGRLLDFGIGRTQFNHFHPFRDTEPSDPKTQRNRKVQLACSAVMMVRRRLFLEMGGFDEHLIYHYQDVDFCARLNERSLEVWVLADARAFHRGSSANVNREPYKIDERAYYTAKNQSILNVDFALYLEESLNPFRDRLAGETFGLVDLSTTTNPAEILEVLRNYTNFEVLATRPVGTRDSDSISLIDKLDRTCMNSKLPLLLVVDRHISLRRNSLWRHLRDTTADLVVDRHANVALFNQVCEGITTR